MTHCFPDSIPKWLKDQADAGQLTGPEFVGQGLSRRVGSDSYGYFIVSISKTSKGKPLIGIADADAAMGPGGWVDGVQKCSLPNGKSDPAECQPDFYITTYGMQYSPQHPAGLPKWWMCDCNGVRTSRKVSYDWNGAYGYLDPSF